MYLILALLVIAGPVKTINVRQAATPPRIDGVIEDAWLQADSVDDFVQASPDEGTPPSERTVIYVLQDAGNLYVAFRCHAARHRPVAQLYGMEEEATLFLDPTDSRSMAYFFKVYGSGLWRSGKILDDGRDEDWSWDAVWYCANRIQDSMMEVEMKIPFKSIRYKQGANEWGINFHRFVTNGMENDYWTDVKEREGGNRVSNYGRLVGINPRAHGYYFELYPEGYVRFDQSPGTAGKVKPFASLNFKWDLTPQATVNATVLPDFAQIESDPYSFNISRYPTFLPERRPFFVEGSENFRLANLREQGILAPLNIFYSRQIGKAVRNEPVPILSGLKFTTHSENWNFGALGAYTDQLADSTGVYEPRRAFAVVRGKGRLVDASDVGFLFGGTTAGDGNYNYALAGDWGSGSGRSRAEVQTALSDKDGRLGWALNSGCMEFMGKFLSLAAFQVISDSFSVEGIGYVPWAGLKKFQVLSGPYLTGHGAMRRFYAAPSLTVTQEPGSNDLSYNAGLHLNPQFRNGWYANLDGGLGRMAEADTAYFARSVNVEAGAGSVRYSTDFGANYNHSYNYARGFVADNYSDWAYFTYYLAGRVALLLGANNWWECDPQGEVLGVTTVARPKIDYRINQKMSFNVYDEIVLSTPGTHFEKTGPATNRVGCLFSWNFLPKSWLYVAFNDYRVDSGKGLTLASRVGAVKLRYLFYF
jgi:hypothetical protein